MYDDHYGLSGRPFQLTPDPKFWFDTATHRKAMAYLGYGLSQGEGFVVITGDPGAGKTTLVGHLLAEIDRERMNVIKIVSTQLKPDDLLRLVCAGLDIDAAPLSKAAMLAAIEKGLHAVARGGKRTLLVVDEAQSLPLESLEELRMLSNFQAGGYPLLQIFLLGQPEFRLRLQDSRLEQLRQRVIAMHHLDPMDADEVEPYLIHRLSCVGWRGKPRFTNDAIHAMYRWSHGSPRRLNQLASRVLLFGAIEQIDSFGSEELAAVIADLDNDVPERAPAPAARREPYELREVAPMAMGSPMPPPPERPWPLAAEAPPGAPVDPNVNRRIAELEAHIKEQDEALRRVLSLLVDWVEGGEQRPNIAPIRGNAA
jgi:general secretion pathway protein A